jgi:hypothetical protein
MEYIYTPSGHQTWRAGISPYLVWWFPQPCLMPPEDIAHFTALWCRELGMKNFQRNHQKPSEMFMANLQCMAAWPMDSLFWKLVRSINMSHKNGTCLARKNYAENFIDPICTHLFGATHPVGVEQCSVGCFHDIDLKWLVFISPWLWWKILRGMKKKPISWFSNFGL